MGLVGVVVGFGEVVVWYGVGGRCVVIDETVLW